MVAMLEERTDAFRAGLSRLREHVSSVIVGHEEAIDLTLTALLAGGHILLEGVPGIGKTYMVRTLAQALSTAYSRIQFTPDLMPADIIGTVVVHEDEGGRRSFRFQQGPVFAGVVLADEINRATPKTQSALLEAMQEGAVTVSGTRHPLPAPFTVIATQNPIEMEGTYPLPEAQLDRFFFKIVMRAPGLRDTMDIVERTTGTPVSEPESVLNNDTLAEMRRLAREVPMAGHVLEYAARVVRATHPDDPGAPDEIRRFVRYGASPRGAQAIVLAAKVRALAAGEYNVSTADVRHVAVPALRHRVLLGFEAEAEGISPDSLVQRVLEQTPELDGQPR